MLMHRRYSRKREDVLYEFKERVRYSETDEHETAAILSVVNYLQDCSTFHSTEAGQTVERLREEKRAWLLSYWDIYIERMPALCEYITIGTSPHAFRGVLAQRNFWIKDASSAYILRADSLWFCYDTERQRPAKITEDMIAPYGELRDVLKLPASERKIQEPEGLSEAEAIPVQPHHIDSNHHVNNARYIAISEEVLRQHGCIRCFTGGRIRAEYRKAAVLGDTLFPKYGRTEKGWIVSLQDRDGRVFCNVEIGAARFGDEESREKND